MRRIESKLHRLSRSHHRLFPAAILLLAVLGQAWATPPIPSAERAEEYAARAPKSIVELQQFRRVSSIPVGEAGEATLVELNPGINTWALLTVDAGGRKRPATYHLENPAPHLQQLRLERDFPQGLIVSGLDGDHRCILWSADGGGALEAARATRLPYAPLCEDRLYLRNPVEGRRTRLEQVTDFLRDNVWGGESIVGFVREAFFSDAFLESGAAGNVQACPPPSPETPANAAVSDEYAGQTVIPENLGIDVSAPARRLSLGCWYPVAGAPGVFLSAIQPKAIPEEILKSHRNRVSILDSVESSALDYLIAFDLDRLEVNFELGTDHPRLDWSGRPGAGVRDGRLPGPDGIGKPDPVISTGMIAPAVASRAVAVFTGGFKRSHGAFRYGPLATKNHGSHYGFIANGTVFSKLQPGLSTLYVLDDGSVHIKTWTEADNRLLGSIRHARQNGVPLIESDPASGEAVPGALVSRWGHGNWSGSAEGKLRSLRAGACILETPTRRFLAYGYFSTATPSAMTRVFQAYGCKDAMLLDMNALEHTYMALYVRQNGRIGVQHLIEGMTEVDKHIGNELIPRFMGFPDNRDFFYLTRREVPR